MEVFEYYGRISENGQLPVPDELRGRLSAQTRLRVMVFLERDESDWKNTATAKFLQGYAEEDDIYDSL